MAGIKPDFTKQLKLFKEAVAFVQEATCDLPPEMRIPALLAFIGLQIGRVTIGGTRYDITPYTLNGTAQTILEKRKDSKVRNVAIWVDSASGGPTPTIRISKGATAYTGGGIRVNAGQVNELGDVPPDTELWGSASTSIVVYVLERA